jgi:threonyl-tRNA synthetase
MAVLKKFPSAKLGIGPVIENGFYYDFKLPRPLAERIFPIRASGTLRGPCGAENVLKKVLRRATIRRRTFFMKKIRKEELWNKRIKQT